MGKIKLSPLLPVLLLLIPLDKWGVFSSCLLGIFVHEAFHLFAVLLVGGELKRLEFRLGGAMMKTSPLSYGQELFCALVGPAGEILLGVFLRGHLPWLWFFSLCHGAYNLLPVYPLDGGRALRCLLCLFLSLERAEAVSGQVGRWTMVVVGLFSAVYIPRYFPAWYALLPVGILALQTLGSSKTAFSRAA